MIHLCQCFRMLKIQWAKPVTVKSRYYTDIDRDGHEISRFGGLPRELYFPKGL